MVVGYDYIISNLCWIVKSNIERCNKMNTSQETAQAIKEVAKERGTATGEMLAELGLNKNTLSSMTSRGSWLQADSLGRIADYLNCSTDYLLGRTTAPEQPMQFQTTKEQKILAAYKAHPELQPAIDKLLGIGEEEITMIKGIARTKTMSRTVFDASVEAVRVPKSKVRAALEDKSIKTDDDL